MKTMLRRHQRSIIALAVLILLGLALHGHGFGGIITGWMKAQPSPQRYAIQVTASRPTEGAFDVPLDTVITADLKLPAGGIDPDTVNAQNIMLIRSGHQRQVAARVRIVNGKTLQVTPDEPLLPATNYTVIVTGGVRHRSGASVIPYASSFTTINQLDPEIRFDKVALPTTNGTGFLCLRIGPDGKLWAGADDGRFFIFPIAPDGTLGKPRIISSLQKYNHGPRIMIGFCFDPASTPTDPIVWASNSAFTFNNAPDFAGKITRLAGADLQDVGDVVIHLPRSIRDHMTNQPSIGPDGALYFPQGSSSSYGWPDEIWGMRREHLLNATILRLDLSKVTPGHPIDALTRDAGGNYDPYAPNAPLTIYASGLRNAYDLCWHSNGHLYVPTNGSSAGGNAPAGPTCPPIKDVSTAEDDWLFKIRKGAYCGHPNPEQNHYVLNGGHPTAAYTFGETFQYPLGTLPDPDFVPACYSFGKHASADGVVEYLGNAFHGKLNHKLVICRYNVGSDLVFLGLDKNGDVDSEMFGLPGASQLVNPLDVTEDDRTGNLYVSEYGALRITLIRPIRP